MSNIHRFYIPDSTVFITSVTHQRRPILMGGNIPIIWSVLKKVQSINPFSLLAYCFLPDHFHWLLKMPENNPRFSDVIHSFKRNWTWEYKKKNSIDESTQVWQPRFWDHVIRDVDDFERHFHYIHFNPVKHGYVEYPEQWPDSSFRFWQEKGIYPDQWKATQEGPDSLFGE